MNLGENIYRLRTARNMSQGDLAETLDVSRQSVSKWENNSAVPELDKLMKMAQIFGTTLDELVTGEEKEQFAPPVQPAPIRETLQESTPVVNVQFPMQKVLGLVLICLGALAVILGLAFPSMGERNSSLVVVVGLCGMVCGVLCLCVQYPQIFCGWTAWAGYLVYTFMLTSRWEEQTLLIILAALGLIAMLVWTAWAQRSGRARMPKWLLIVGGTVVVLLVILFIINTAPPIPLVGEETVVPELIPQMP